MTRARSETLAMWDKSAIKSEVKLDQHPLDLATQQLAEELHNSFIRRFEQQKLYSFFKDNLWGADLTDKQLIDKHDKGFRFYYVLLMFIVRMHGLFLCNTEMYCNY